ncbi:hypothetical protein POM88_016875 [Heracleum sosnowskyi]|uniref:MLO-like protein n=1 Tax=Heracleum sosnowskyi TaxID=360622 RepID=A0AAD8MXV8_9APIA|nr:hypothetical protein POM88_016875 [Heracleum sosnowskyi]
MASTGHRKVGSSRTVNGFNESSSSVDWLGREMLKMRLRDKDKVDHDDERESEPELVNGVGAEAGHVIRTTIGGRNGQSRQAISYIAEHVVGTGSFGVVCREAERRVDAPRIYITTTNRLTSFNNGHRRLLSEGSQSQYCEHKGKVPLFSREAIHQLHIFIFVLAVVHVIFCATTTVLGSLKIQQWKCWEQSSSTSTHAPHEFHKHHLQRSIFKQFYGSVTKSDYIALQAGFTQEHCPSTPKFNFHTYMLRTLEHDFKHMVGISWYLWLFVVLFLLLNLADEPYRFKV